MTILFACQTQGLMCRRNGAMLQGADAIKGAFKEEQT